MPTKTSVLTTTRKTITTPVELTYRYAPCPAKQKRFANREALEPMIGLTAYVRRQVIDSFSLMIR